MAYSKARRLANVMTTSAGIPTASIVDDAVTLAKMAAGTDGQIITYDASGNPTAVGPGTDGQVLTSTGAGSPPAFEDASGAYSDWTVLTTTPTNLVSKGQYVCNDTTARTHTLPTASVSGGNQGDTVIIANAGSATVTIARNSSNINSAAEDGTLPQGNSVQLVYVDDTIGWFEI